MKLNTDNINNGLTSRQRALACHLSAFAGLIFPLGNILAPLVIWLSSKKSPYIEAEAKESLNFQVSMLVYTCAAAVLVIIAGPVPVIAVLIVQFGFVIKAALEVKDKGTYRYPLNLRLI